MAYFGKEFTLASQENFDAFLASLKIPDEYKGKLQGGGGSKSTLKLEKNGDSYTYTSTSAALGGLTSVTFTPGVEFDQKLLGAIDTKNVVEVDGDVLTHTMKTGDGKWIKFQREFSAEQVIVTITGSDFNGVAKRIYKP